ncbi:hypothetical protein EC9_32440 [Rosistilla ulvae]|uniref:Uncharacterized protein n=1 Tax=Rosistilla ulvae TaxID=1930277 RepID=A0A517M2F1_9BACT|nr:hypothetical protein EC9_32440 [Rosistilla ulvae]
MVACRGDDGDTIWLFDAQDLPRLLLERSFSLGAGREDLVPLASISH